MLFTSQITCQAVSRHALTVTVINFSLYIVQNLTVESRYTTVCYFGRSLTSPVELMLLWTPCHLC